MALKQLGLFWTKLKGSAPEGWNLCHLFNMQIAVAIIDTEVFNAKMEAIRIDF